MLRYMKCLLPVVLILLGTCAFAQTNYPATLTLQNQVTTNNCSTAEPVALSGDVNLQYNFTTDSNGVNHFNVTVGNNLTGVGQNTAGSYTASDSNQYEIETSQPNGEITVEFRSDLNPQTGGAGMILLQSIDITVDTAGNIAGTVLSNTTQCGSATQ